METNGTQAGVDKKRRGRALRTAANVRKLLADEIRRVEADASITGGERSRLISNLSVGLLRAIELSDRVADVEREIARLEKLVAEVVERRQGMAS
jgi:hypothetical protein